MTPGTISRRDKGRVAKAPRLAGTPQRVAAAVEALAGVVAQAHWEIGSEDVVNGADFYVGEEELGHIHLDGEAHIPVGKQGVAALVKAGLAKRFRWSPHFAAVDAHDVDTAVWIFGLRHQQIAGLSDEDVVALIRARKAGAPSDTDGSLASGCQVS